MDRVITWVIDSSILQEIFSSISKVHPASEKKTLELRSDKKNTYLAT